jgi:hypothetical protein
MIDRGDYVPVDGAEMLTGERRSNEATLAQTRVTKILENILTQKEIWKHTLVPAISASLFSASFHTFFILVPS